MKAQDRQRIRRMIAGTRAIFARDSEFNEADHPRDHGKFTSGSGNSGGSQPFEAHENSPLHPVLTKHGFEHTHSSGGKAIGSLPLDKTESNHHYAKEGHRIHVKSGKNDNMKHETTWRHTPPGESTYKAAGNSTSALHKHLSGETNVKGVHYY